ncbi:MAG: isochorismatase family cysteine hydrolase [Pyrinomonadaceae bacterium]
MAEIQNPVLVVIDMQKGFLNDHSRHIVQNVDGLIRCCQNLLIPVVFSRFFNFAGSPYETLIGWNRVNNEPETDIVDDLLPLVEALIDKSVYTAITPEFVTRIGRNGWKTIILCGIATESCVLKTAADAFELGLLPIVISDACASDRGEEFHKAALKILPRFIGKDQIMTANKLLEYLAA